MNFLKTCKKVAYWNNVALEWQNSRFQYQFCAERCCYSEIIIINGSCVNGGHKSYLSRKFGNKKKEMTRLGRNWKIGMEEEKGEGWKGRGSEGEFWVNLVSRGGQNRYSLL